MIRNRPGKAGERLGKKGNSRRTSTRRQGVGPGVKLHGGGQGRKFNGGRGKNRGDQHDSGIHLAMDEHGDGTFVAGLIGIGMQQFVQSGAGHHGAQQQDKRHQQRGD